ncbi:hypothetical protein [Paraburkholderia xenovorans]|uniref:hypothetical protein n=1 Tax=Paraburkholderia xenovorans TaxID=36873 RepID=UPI0038B8DBA9
MISTSSRIAMRMASMRARFASRERLIALAFESRADEWHRLDARVAHFHREDRVTVGLKGELATASTTFFVRLGAELEVPPVEGIIDVGLPDAAVRSHRKHNLRPAAEFAAMPHTEVVLRHTGRRIGFALDRDVVEQRTGLLQPFAQRNRLRFTLDHVRANERRRKCHLLLHVVLQRRNRPVEGLQARNHLASRH